MAWRRNCSLENYKLCLVNSKSFSGQMLVALEPSEKQAGPPQRRGRRTAGGSRGQRSPSSLGSGLRDSGHVLKAPLCARSGGPGPEPPGLAHGFVTRVGSSPGGLAHREQPQQEGPRHAAAARVQLRGGRAAADADLPPGVPGVAAGAAVPVPGGRLGARARAGAVVVALGLVLRGPALQPAPGRLLPDGARVARVDLPVAGQRVRPAHGRARPGALGLPVRHGRVRRLPAVAPQPVGPVPVGREPRPVLAARLQRLRPGRHQQRGGVQAPVRAAALPPGAGGLPLLQPRGAQGGALLQPAGALPAAGGPRAQPAHRAPGAGPASRAALPGAHGQGAGPGQRHRAGHQRHLGGGRPPAARGGRGVPQPRAHRRGRAAQAAALPARPLPAAALRGPGAGAAAPHPRALRLRRPAPHPAAGGLDPQRDPRGRARRPRRGLQDHVPERLQRVPGLAPRAALRQDPPGAGAVRRRAAAARLPARGLRGSAARPGPGPAAAARAPQLQVGHVHPRAARALARGDAPPDTHARLPRLLLPRGAWLSFGFSLGAGFPYSAPKAERFPRASAEATGLLLRRPLFSLILSSLGPRQAVVEKEGRAGPGREWGRPRELAPRVCRPRLRTPDWVPSVPRPLHQSPGFSPVFSVRRGRKCFCFVASRQHPFAALQVA